MKIDLQIHTTHSDGWDTPRRIAELASAGGLNIISVTDHDVVSAINEVQNESSKFDIKVIAGTEISTTFRNKTLHILGYNMDIQNQELLDFLDRNNDYRKQALFNELLIVNENLKKASKREINIENYRNKGSKYYSQPGLALFMYEEGITDSRAEGFDYFKGIESTMIPVEPVDAFRVIRQAGGKVILSHPLGPKISLKQISSDKSEQEKMIAEFSEHGLDGLECYGTGHNQEDTEFCLAMCEKYNLIITAGSDWHGSLEQVGESVKKYLPYYIKKLGELIIPEESIQKMIKDLSIK